VQTRLAARLAAAGLSDPDLAGDLVGLARGMIDANLARPSAGLVGRVTRAARGYLGV
jgi:hypothetical protein